MKIYFDKKLIIKEYVSFLAPVLGMPDFEIRWENKEQIQDRYQKGKWVLEKSDMKNCDYMVYPKYFLLDHFDELKAYSEKAKKNKKKVIVFSYGEIDDYIDINDNIVRYKRSTNIKNPDNEHCLPPFPEDLSIYCNEQIKYIQEKKPKRYSIGYVWYANYHNIRSFLYYIWVRLIGLICRISICKRLLMRTKNNGLYIRLVNAGIWNFCRGKTIRYIKRLKQYTFHFLQRSHALTPGTQKEKREQYIHNLIGSDIALVIRGFWNYSFRMYEAMSLWKILLYIDTWAKLAFSEEIWYKDICIIIEFNDIHNIWTHIDNFLQKNKGKLMHIQKKTREIYEEYFTMSNYYARIIKEMEQELLCFL